ncbi:MAG: zinc ribbon domain-containing protein [Magnetococcales bacterium]|nr:zinc ribbon domain-containing protein [Magnetococcales bacterium]
MERRRDVSCGNCGHTEPLGEASCSHCGTFLDQPCPTCGEPTPPQASICPSCSGTCSPFCPECETPNPPNTLFCQECGVPINPAPEQPARSAFHKGAITVAVAALVIFPIVTGMVAYFNHRLELDIRRQQVSEKAELESATREIHKQRAVKAATNCSHVFPGKTFEKSGILGFGSTAFTVVKFSKELNVATVTDEYTNTRKEISCDDVPP